MCLTPNLLKIIDNHTIYIDDLLAKHRTAFDIFETAQECHALIIDNVVNIIENHETMIGHHSTINWKALTRSWKTNSSMPKAILNNEKASPSKPSNIRKNETTKAKLAESRTLPGEGRIR